MFTNKKIERLQKWNEKDICFEADSSPKAWEHYTKYYSPARLQLKYKFSDLFFYNDCNDLGFKNVCEEGKEYKYINEPKLSKSDYNRLYALHVNAEVITKNKIKYAEPANRLGGDCDFNFNEKKYSYFSKIIESDYTVSEERKEVAKKQLFHCKEMHHSLLNFSLMEAMGNMQKFKGSNRFDRFDTFLFRLKQFYLGINTEVLSASSAPNKSALIFYLNGFNDIYDYCKTMYFIDNKFFVDELLRQGEMSINSCDDVIRYMNLAEAYWENKENHFLKKEFLLIDTYFSNAEAYTKEALLYKLFNDLGLNELQGNELIEKCIHRGYIIESTPNVYTR